MPGTTDPIDLGSGFLLLGDNGVTAVDSHPGPPLQLDGYLIGAPLMTSAPPHSGEMHPDGDEILYVVSGRIEVTLEEPEGDRRVNVDSGQAFVVPQGIWHRVHFEEPTRLLHVTPGPGAEHRPLS